MASGDIVDPDGLNPKSASAWMNWCSEDMVEDEQFAQVTIAALDKLCRGDEYDKTCGLCIEATGIRRPPQERKDDPPVGC